MKVFLKKLCCAVLPEKEGRLFGTYSSAGLLAGALVGLWIAIAMVLYGTISPALALLIPDWLRYLLLFFLPFPALFGIMLPYALVKTPRIRCRRLIPGVFIVSVFLVSYLAVFGVIFKPLISFDALSIDTAHKLFKLLILYYFVFLLLICLFFGRHAPVLAKISLPAMVWTVVVIVFLGATLSGVGSRIFGAAFAAATVSSALPLFGFMLWGTLDL